MSRLDPRSTLHRRMSNFVDWIRGGDKDERIISQSSDIRARIRIQAEKDGLTVRSTPNSGSFAKKTGLRRHLLGDSPVEGQDVDLPFVISPHDESGARIEELLGRFNAYAATCYPQTKRQRTRSSIQLDFSDSKLRYDLVPMLAVPGDDEAQILLRGDGSKRRTSVQRHTEFITRRNRTNNELPGRVRFNDCIRLLKWWREFRQAHARVIEEVPSILLDLLCAHAYDRCKVEETYAGTLACWFDLLAGTVRRGQRVSFDDFGSVSAPASSALWMVLDPVNADNNIVSLWNSFQIQELGDWFEEGFDTINRAIAADHREDDQESLESLVDLFGNPFKHYCEGRS